MTYALLFSDHEEPTSIRIGRIVRGAAGGSQTVRVKVEYRMRMRSKCSH